MPPFNTKQKPKAPLLRLIFSALIGVFLGLLIFSDSKILCIYPSSPYLPCKALNTTFGLNFLKVPTNFPSGSQILTLYFFLIFLKTALAVIKLISLSREKPPAKLIIFFSFILL